MSAPLQFYDFFAGVGMAEVGLSPEWSCVWANDIDARKAAIHSANLDHSMYVTEDITRILPSQLPTPADMAWASFPCQDLSVAGWRRGMSAERSGLFWAFWKLMCDLQDRSLRPPLIVIENVPGLLCGQDFNGLCEALLALDLQFGAILVNSEPFLPHSRPRVFVVGADRSLDLSRWTTSSMEDSPWFTNSIQRAYDGLPDDLKDYWRWWRLPVPDVSNRPMIEDLIDSVPSDVTWHTADETKRLLSLMSEMNRTKVDERMHQSERAIGFVYKRMRRGLQRAEVRFDGVAGCLRTPSGGSSRQVVLVVEHGLVKSRVLSPREAARLMGLPDGFRLPEQYYNAYRAMGDGVAVPVVSWLGQHLLSPIARQARSNVVSNQLPLVFANGARRSAERAAASWALART